MPETYTGNEGTAAFNDDMNILDGTEDRRDGWLAINKTRDYIVAKIAAVLDRVWPVEKGGTGATTPAAARTNLGIPPLSPPNAAEPDSLPVYNSNRQLTTADPTLGGHAASKQYVDSRPIPPQQFLDDGTTYSVVGRHLSASGNIISTTGTFYAGAATPATSNYAVAYFNGDGRLSRGASSARYKKYIRSAPDLGDIWPDLREFQMRGGDGDWKIGYIAEELLDTPAARFIVWTELDGELVPDSIDFIALLIAQNAQLHQDLDLLAQRLAALEEG